MSENENKGFGQGTGDQRFGARGTDGAMGSELGAGTGATDMGAGAGIMGAPGAMGAGAMGAGAVSPSGVAAGAGTTGLSAGAGGMASAVFDSHEEAQRAVAELRSAGISDDALSIIAHHGGKTTTTSGDGEITDEHHRNIIRGILGGGALGAGLGVAALAIPGVGPLAAAGAIAASVVPEAMALGAAAGAVGGTLNETLTKHGVSDEDASYYGDRIKGGGVFVSVDTGRSGVSADIARDILYRNGGHSSSRSKAS